MPTFCSLPMEEELLHGSFQVVKYCSVTTVRLCCTCREKERVAVYNGRVLVRPYKQPHIVLVFVNVSVEAPAAKFLLLNIHLFFSFTLSD